MSVRVSTGIQGLDNILLGGLIARRTYLVYGEPGTGKTTVGLHFLSAGVSIGETALMIAFGQPEDQIRADARSIGLNISSVKILDLTARPEAFAENESYDIFAPAEVEREFITAQISKEIEEVRPARIFVDSLGQFRSLTMDDFHHRRLVQSFFQFATFHGATVVAASEESEYARDVDGVIQLEFVRLNRTILIVKFRGSDFQAGYHPMRLTSSGLKIPLTAA